MLRGFPIGKHEMQHLCNIGPVLATICCIWLFYLVYTWGSFGPLCAETRANNMISNKLVQRDVFYRVCAVLGGRENIYKYRGKRLRQVLA